MDVHSWDWSLLRSLKAKCRKARKHQRQPQRHHQSETSKNSLLCYSGDSVDSQRLLWSIRLLQIKEQGSTSYKLSQSQNRGNLACKKQVFVSLDSAKSSVWHCFSKGKDKVWMSLCATELTSPGQIREVPLIHHLKHNSKEAGGSIYLPVLCLFLYVQEFLSLGLLI